MPHRLTIASIVCTQLEIGRLFNVEKCYNSVEKVKKSILKISMEKQLESGSNNVKILFLLLFIMLIFFEK